MSTKLDRLAMFAMSNLFTFLAALVICTMASMVAVGIVIASVPVCYGPVAQVQSVTINNVPFVAKY